MGGGRERKDNADNGKEKIVQVTLIKFKNGDSEVLQVSILQRCY